LAPPGVAATLVNLSTSGALVECTSRPLPGTLLTVHFAGTFTPAAIEGRVVRCEVAGIAANGSLRYHLGLAFSTSLALPVAAEDDAAAGEAAPTLPPPASVAEPILRNRW
jgi:hypothetical protein